MELTNREKWIMFLSLLGGALLMLVGVLVFKKYWPKPALSENKNSSPVNNFQAYSNPTPQPSTTNKTNSILLEGLRLLNKLLDIAKQFSWLVPVVTIKIWLGSFLHFIFPLHFPYYYFLLQLYPTFII